MNTRVFKKYIPYIISIALLMMVAIIYFLPQIQGKAIAQGDISSWQGMAHEVNEYKKETGITSLWTNSIFGGMPTYQINSNQPYSLLPYVSKLLNGGFLGAIGLFFRMMLAFYIAMVALRMGPWVSLIMAIGFGLSTGNMILYEAGHITKLRSIAYCAPIIAGVILTYRQRWLVGALLFTVGMALNIYSNHYQMTFYLFLVMLIFVISELISAVKRGELTIFGKSTGLLVLCGVLAIASNATKLYTTYIYSQDTMRGKPILSQVDNTVKSSSQTDGLAWEYAMNWSNGGRDLLASFAPGVVGGGSSERVGKSSPLRKDRIWTQVLKNNKDRAPMYWGNLPSTSGPYYFGALLMFLFVLGLCIVPGRIKWWLGIAVMLTFLLSMGKNMEFINRLFFDYFPFFNKFRTPNSVLTVTGVLIPIMAAYSLKEVLRNGSDSRILKSLKWTTIIFIGFVLGLILLGPSIFDFSNPVDARYASQGLGVGPLEDARRSFFRQDLLRSLTVILLGAGVLYLLIKNKINKIYGLVLIGIISVVDLWMVNKRYVNDDDFVSKKTISRQFTPRPVDAEILKDQDPNYRVLDLSVNTYNSSISSYHHKTIGGYNAAKLQRYQDIIDRHLSKGNVSVVNMLNTKYIITQDQKAQRNPDAMNNAWFVQQAVMVPNADAEINALNTEDIKITAIVHNEFKPYLSVSTFSGEGRISLTSYAPNHLTYSTESPSNQLAVFSEVWYGPNKGWNAYIDGERVDHIRANYVLRALKIPAGKHKVEFKFEPTTLAGVTFISSGLVILFLLGSVFLWWRSSSKVVKS